MSTKEQMTNWQCPECGVEKQVPAYELAQVGTPHCINCPEVEMEESLNRHYQKNELILMVTRSVVRRDEVDRVSEEIMKSLDGVTILELGIEEKELTDGDYEAYLQMIA